MEDQPQTAPNADTRIPVGMRPGQRQFGAATLTVSMSTAVPAHMREHTREITHVFVPVSKRGQRMATTLVNFVCQEADANKITLLLTAKAPESMHSVTGDGYALKNDTSGPSTTQLIAWYEKFGFVKLQDTPNGMLMARQVRERPRIKPVTLGIARALSQVLH